MTRAIPTARRIPHVAPGDPAWLQLITGSKIGAILGLSPFESRFSLWHRMAGTVPADPMTDEMDRGHRLEDAVRGWWADQEPEARLQRCKSTFVHRHRSWQAVSPDGLVSWQRAPSAPIEPYEGKTAAGHLEDWGDEDTDAIPLYYKAQVQWALDVLGLPRGRVAVLTRGLEFRKYTVDRDEEDAAFMRAAALDFKRSIEDGEQPEIDSHTATYRTLRKLHPDIEDREVEVRQDQADRYRAAVMIDQDSEQRRRLETARIAVSMGNAHYAKDPKGVRFAIRSGNPPSVRQGGPRKQWERAFIL